MFRHRGAISREYVNKGIYGQHAYVGVVLPSLKRVNQLKYKNSKMHKVYNHKIIELQI
jgi:hypothetical protein